MKVTYKDKLYIMLASTVSETAAKALYKAILQLNGEQTGKHITQHQNSIVRHTPVSALRHLSKDIGPIQ